MQRKVGYEFEIEHAMNIATVCKTIRNKILPYPSELKLIIK